MTSLAASASGIQHTSLSRAKLANSTGQFFQLGGFCLRKQPLKFSLPVEDESRKKRSSQSRAEKRKSIGWQYIKTRKSPGSESLLLYFLFSLLCSLFLILGLRPKKSGWRDSNPRPLAPQGRLRLTRVTPICLKTPCFRQFLHFSPEQNHSQAVSNKCMLFTCFCVIDAFGASKMRQNASWCGCSVTPNKIVARSTGGCLSRLNDK